MTRDETSAGASFVSDRLLTLVELCAWLSITERHARKLVEREAIPYRKVGHLLRFSRSEVEAWSRPNRTASQRMVIRRVNESLNTGQRSPGRSQSNYLPRSLLD